MIFTFANRTVGMVGRFENSPEIMTLVIQYLGGTVYPMLSKYVVPEVIVIGMNTPEKELDDIENYFRSLKNGPQFVYEGKINDHMPDERTFGEIVDRVKKELPWAKSY